MVNRINKIIMKHLNLILVLILPNFIFSQSKAIVPVTGTIAFAREEIVLDKDLYAKSLNELMPKMKKAIEQQILFERLDEGKATDTITLKSEIDLMAENFETMLPLMIEDKKSVIKFHHDFNGDKITSYYSLNGKQQVNDKLIINQTTFEVTNEKNEFTEIERKEVVKIIELKNETKILNGLKCFKVIYTYIEPQKSDFDFMSTITNNTRELWVTEEIKCNYHPVINETEILEKYYPLEIIEYSDEIKGFITKYELVEFSLK